MTHNTSSRHVPGNDEIDLIELFQAMWTQKWLILLITLVVTAGAASYAFLSKPIYESRIIITPAPISEFGSITGALGVKQIQTSESVIAAGVALANDGFGVLVKNLESQKVRRDFVLSSNESYSGVSFEVKKGRMPSESVTIIANGPSAIAVTEQLEAFFEYASGVSAAQLNEYFRLMEVGHQILPGSLYSADLAAEVNPKPVKPKKALILALGIVLGGVLGVFIALIRQVFRKRSAIA